MRVVRTFADIIFLQMDTLWWQNEKSFIYRNCGENPYYAVSHSVS